jgi:hypothetical protein
LPDPRPGHSGEKNTTWEISGRYTQINGVVQPLFPSAHGFVPAGIFHIHTNPFQVTDIRNDQGQSIFDASGNCTAAEVSTGDRQYCGMLGVVRDTLFIKPGYTMVMRTRYVDYTGEYVMHCHILDHEDQGMMQNVSIVSPSTALLRRLTTPLSLASSRVRAAVEKLIGNPGTEDALAFSAPICSSSRSLLR